MNLTRCTNTSKNLTPRLLITSWWCHTPGINQSLLPVGQKAARKVPSPFCFSKANKRCCSIGPDWMLQSNHHATIGIMNTPLNHFKTTIWKITATADLWVMALSRPAFSLHWEFDISLHTCPYQGSDSYATRTQRETRNSTQEDATPQTLLNWSRG